MFQIDTFFLLLQLKVLKVSSLRYRKIGPMSDKQKIIHIGVLSQGDMLQYTLSTEVPAAMTTTKMSNTQVTAKHYVTSVRSLHTPDLVRRAEERKRENK